MQETEMLRTVEIGDRVCSTLCSRVDSVFYDTVMELAIAGFNERKGSSVS